MIILINFIDSSVIIQQQQFDEMNRHFTEESLKSVTPFEMGGYDMTQGNSWNNNDFGGMF